MRPLLLWLVPFSIIAALPVSGLDKAQQKVDALTLHQFTRAQTEITEYDNELKRVLDSQFNRLIDDALHGKMEADNSYLDPVIGIATPIVSSFEAELNKHRVEMLRNTFPRSDSTFVENARQAIAARDELWETTVKPVKDSYRQTTDVTPDGTPVLTLSVFQPLANQLAESLDADGKLLRQVDLEKDRLADFLTDESRPIWEHVKKGRRRAYLTSARKRKIQDILDTYFVSERYFDGEKHLREAVKKYDKRDKHSSLHLLYAFVLLINGSDENSTSRGYAELDRAFDKLRTERLAYNLVRVGARLKNMDEKTLWKLIDHADFRDDSGGLGNLYNLAMLRFLQEADYPKALKLYNTLLERDKATNLAPAFVFITLLRNGEFRRLNDEVSADSVDELRGDADS